MANGIATARLDEKSLGAYLNFPAWREQAIVSDAAAGPQTDKVCRAEQEKIRTLLARERGGWLGDAPFTLKKPLLILFILGRVSEEQYLVFCDICDALNRNRPPCVATFDESNVWQEAIAIARKRSSPNAGLAKRYSRAQAVARSIQRVETLGFPVQVTSFGPSFTPETLEVICAKISDGVKRLGGRSFANTIFRWFSDKQRIYHGSLLYGRVVDQFGNLRDPSVPWHYLYNLALRHLGVPAQSGASQADFNAVVDLARDMAAVFDVEMYTVYENMAGVGHSSFHHSILDRVIYDELFAFQQWQPEVAVQLFGSLLGYLREKSCIIPLASVEQWTAFADALLLASAESDLTIRHPSECASAAVDADLALKLFEALALPLSGVNSQYLTPLDTHKRNAPYSPFYAYSTDLYLLPPRAILARGLYEGVYTLLRKHNLNNIENWLGEALEQMTADAIAQLGHWPAIVRQQYRIPGQRKKEAPFEVDVAELTDRHVFLFECKKKALTNSARAGNTLAAAVDFARGFFYPLIQANRHESELRSPAGLTLLNGKNFKLNGRNVQRIAVTMTDHGSMQDRAFLRGMIGGLWGTNLTSVDPAFQKDADEINRYVLELTTGITDLATLAGESRNDYTRVYVGGCWFFGIDQLRFLCSKGADLRSAISPLGSITYGTGDIMTELAHSDKSGLLNTLRDRIGRNPN